MQKRNIVKQDYRLINSKYKLNTAEMKFVLIALAQIKREDEELKIYSIGVNEIAEIMNRKQNHTQLKQFVKKLLSKPIVIDTENNGFIVANWFADIEYINNEARFEVTISHKLKPYLLELKSRFVTFNMQYILPLASNYSIRIYQLLKESEKLTKRTFTVAELQSLLQVPKSLLNYADFKRKVLKVAERELIENCDIFFEYEEIKTGRRVTEILFRIKSNKNFEEPKLFEAEETEYKKYIGKTMMTNEGEQKITVITPFDNFLKVSFENDGHAKFESFEKFKNSVRT